MLSMRSFSYVPSECLLGDFCRLIAEGDVNGLPLAESAINEYLNATPGSQSGLRLIQQSVLVRRDAVGRHRLKTAAGDRNKMPLRPL